MTSGNFWHFYRDKIDGVNDNASLGNSYKYKTKNNRNNNRTISIAWKSKIFNQQAQTPVPSLKVEFKIPFKHLNFLIS